jgi:DNA-directed RNA polymerase specialized sigma24 family protein
LLLGYGGLTLDEIARGAAVLVEAVRSDARRGSTGR